MSRAAAVTLVSLAVMLVALVVLAAALPIDRVLSFMEQWLDSLGAWGPVAYGAFYAAAVVLLVPGLPLSLAAGAAFGPVWGTVVVSLGSIAGASIAFLIARYAARGRVAAAVAGHSRLGAIDRAIGRSGWKIVALLRLTPAVPFSVSNYVFGLTPVGFVPYVLASWVCMLPAALLYVYAGHVGAQGIAAAAGVGDAAAPARVWALRGLVLAVTVLATVYIVRLARRALREEPGIEARPAAAGPRLTPRSAAVTAAAAIVLLGAAVAARLNRDAIRAGFGTPQAVAAEAYGRDVEGPAFDHGVLDALLREHVDAGGRVDYEGLGRDAERLDGYVASLAAAPFDTMGRDERLALLINAYNAFTLRLVLDHWPVASIRDIPADRRWAHRRWHVGGRTWSLDEIEHEQIRPTFREPRIHFALACAAVGCPPLRGEAYTAARLEEQLEDQARLVHASDRWFTPPDAGGTVGLTRLYDWYGGDFEQAAGSVPAFAARYSPELRRALQAGAEPKIRWLQYDWSLNGRGPRSAPP